MNQQQMETLNVHRSVQDHVLDLATLSVGAKVDGIVSSTHELKLLRDNLGNEPLMSRCIRAKGADLNKKSDDLAEAKELGADYIVVGRPIYKSEDPLASVKAILKEIC